MKRNARCLLFALVAALLVTATGTLMAQAPSDPKMVYVHVTAADRDGRFVVGLRREQFKVFEDSMPQELAFFSERDIPISAAILLDVESSIRGQMKEIALAGLTKNSSPADELLVAEVAESPLNDAVYRAMNQLLQRGNDSKRVLVLLTTRTDPGANSFSKVKELLRGQDVRFYVVGLAARPDLPGDLARPLLRELAEISGGSAFFPPSIFQLEQVYGTIGKELRNQYLIGYRSTNGATDGKWRKIKINAEYVDKNKVSKPTIRAKKGYYAPTVAQSLPAKK